MLEILGKALKFLFAGAIAVLFIAFMHWSFNVVLGALGLPLISWGTTTVILLMVRVFKWWLE